MEFGRVIGRVVLTRKDPKLDNLKLLAVQPVDHDYNDIESPLVAVDSVGAGAMSMYFTPLHGMPHGPLVGKHLLMHVLLESSILPP